MFALVDHFGSPVTEANFRGRFALVYFGFTSCRVVCPRALAKLSRVLDALGADGTDRLQPLYISVDPARDTPKAMREYLEGAYPGFLGLTGSERAIDEAKKSFRVFAQRKPDPQDPAGYQVAHTAIAYLLDMNGDYVDHFPDTAGAEEIESRIRSHLREQPRTVQGQPSINHTD